MMQDGTPVASFSVADSQGREKPSIWWRCQLWGKRAESLAPYLTKGQAVTVSGTVTERKYTDKSDGTQKKAMEIRVQDVALQGGNRDAAPAPARAPAPQKAAPASGFDDMDSDCPF